MSKFLFLLFLTTNIFADASCPILLNYASKNSFLMHPQRDLINKVETFGNILDEFENCTASLIRQEAKLKMCLQLNDQLILSYEAILNHYKIETLTFQKEINFRAKRGSYLALTIIDGAKRSEKDLLLTKIKNLADKDTTLEHTIYQLLKDGIETTPLAPKAFMIARRSQGLKNHYSNTYQASLFSKTAITALPWHSNYFNAEILFSSMSSAHRASTALKAPELFSKQVLLSKLNLVEKKLADLYAVSTQLQPLSNSFANAARKISKNMVISHGVQWTISNDFIKVVDADQRALYTHIDGTKTHLIQNFKESLKAVEKWLIKNDLHELLGEGKWMERGATDLDETSNFAQFTEKYNHVLAKQSKILIELAKEQEAIGKIAFRLQSEHRALWQELYQLRDALKDTDPKELKAPLRQFSENLGLLVKLSIKE